MHRLKFAFSLLLVLAVWTFASHDVTASEEGIRLYMFFAPGCGYCEKWEQDIGVIYHRTPQGRAAPLRRVLIDDAPRLFPQFRPIVFTPTFVIARDGRETDRITGYAGEEFFWWRLDEILGTTPGALPAPQHSRW